MKIKSTKQEKGFTIIEVLIVLAIAGLIVLIVFLAVPALQRNSRNTQRKNDITSLLGSIQEQTNNNNGQLPATPVAAAGAGKLSFYDPATDLLGSTTNASAVASVTPTESALTVNNFSKCPAANPAPGAIAALPMGASPTKRNLTIVYRIETSGPSQTICQDL